jgi:hypothetical protein
MDRDKLSKFEQVDGLHESQTSYFSAPNTDLDPNLFFGNRLKPWVRNNISRLLFDHLGVRYSAPNKWVHIWLAGSGVSYQWSAERDPGDLDCLVGINYVEFRKANYEYAGLSDQEIASMFNEGFNLDLMPNTKNWNGYELTYYVNARSDIKDLNPYAAYDLTNDNWTVEPDRSAHAPYSRSWEQQSQRDYDTATELVSRYSAALSDIKTAPNDAYRLNAERRLKLSVEQAVSFYDDIHSGRKAAFSVSGSGYSDFNNYRWQAGKKTGTVPALRAIKQYQDEVKKQEQLDTYGVELPDTRTLIRRAAQKNP